MGHIYKKVEEMIGGTPLLELEKIEDRNSTRLNSSHPK